MIIMKLKLKTLVILFCLFNICKTKYVHADPNFDIGQYTTDLINNLLPSNYNKNLRPNHEGKPHHVNVSILINDISAISETAMEYKVDFYIRHFWNDYRLKFPVKHNVSSVTLGEEFVRKIWLPDSTFDNAKEVNVHKTVFSGSTTMFIIKSNGDILYSTRIAVIAQCPMDLTFFPMDQQKCSIEISSYGYSPNELIYHWAPEPIAVEINPRIFFPTFELLGYSKFEKMSIFSVGNSTAIQCDIFLARSIGFYLSQIYIPTFLIVSISWVPFWLDRNDHHARVALGVTTVLTMTTLITNSRSDFPKISYLKAIDIYLFTSFIMVFLSLIEYATVGYCDYKMSHCRNKKHSISSHANGLFPKVNSENKNGIQNGVQLVQVQTRSLFLQKSHSHYHEKHGSAKCIRKHKDTSVIDMWARWLFPCSFVAFNIIYSVVLFILVAIKCNEQDIQVKL